MSIDNVVTTVAGLQHSGRLGALAFEVAVRDGRSSAARLC